MIFNNEFLQGHHNIYLCVCVCEGERERERVCLYVCVCDRVYLCLIFIILLCFHFCNVHIFSEMYIMHIRHLNTMILETLETFFMMK